MGRNFRTIGINDVSGKDEELTFANRSYRFFSCIVISTRDIVRFQKVEIGDKIKVYAG